MAPEYRQGVGPNRLPQGAAQQLNVRQPRPIDPAMAGYQDMDIPVQFAPEQDEPDEGDRGLSENMQVLLSAPDEGYRPAAVPKDRVGRVPRYAVRHLPELMAAARHPDAPPTLIALYRRTLRDLEAELRSI